MPDLTPIAFLSRKFVPDSVVDAISRLLEPDISCRPANDLMLRPIPQEILKRIKNADLLIAIITKEGDSCWIQNELGMAFSLEKPILVFYEEGVPTDGFAPMVSEYVKFNRNSLENLINDKNRLVSGIIGAVQASRLRQEELDAFSEQRNLGVVGIYPDRKDGFTNFLEPWNNEKSSIHIVSSTLEGFRKFVGVAGHELLEKKINDGCKVDILVTDPEYLKLRAKNENVQEAWIRDQFQQTVEQLSALSVKTANKLNIRCFSGAPTCFTIITDGHMLLNPYPYMRTAYSCFCMIVRRTMKRDDIYHIYHEYHFQRAWDRSKPIKIMA